MREEGKNLPLTAIVLFSVLALCLSVKIQAASFDCAKASIEVEKTICSNPELSKLDEELADFYLNIITTSEKMEMIRSTQKVWMKKRNRCENTACVKQAYKSRLHDLEVFKTDSTSSGKAEAVFRQEALPQNKPLYGHCVDVKDPRNCGRFQSGKGYTVCEKYLEHLNSLPKMPRCEVPVPPSFQRPDWEEVDVMEHLDWAYQAETIRFARYTWHERPADFATWKKEFLSEKEAGKIVPAMRKVRVTPLGESKEVVILAYTRHKAGCQDVVRQISKGTYWSDVGYAHFLLSEALGTSAVEKLEESGPATNQTEMLLFAGKPYFVEEFSSAIYDTPGIMIYAIAPWPMPIANEPGYLFKDFCHFDPMKQEHHK